MVLDCRPEVSLGVFPCRCGNTAQGLTACSGTPNRTSGPTCLACFLLRMSIAIHCPSCSPARASQLQSRVFCNFDSNIFFRCDPLDTHTTLYPPTTPVHLYLTPKPPVNRDKTATSKLVRQRGHHRSFLPTPRRNSTANGRTPRAIFFAHIPHQS